MRVYELAKKYGVPSKRLIDEAKALGVPLKNHMCLIDKDLILLLDKIFIPSSDKKEENPEKASSESSSVKDTAPQKSLPPKPKIDKPEVKPSVPVIPPKEQCAEDRRDEERRRDDRRRPAKAFVEERVSRLELSGPISVKEFSDKIMKKSGEVQTALIKMGHMISVNQVLSVELASKIGEKFEVEVILVSPPKEKSLKVKAETSEDVDNDKMLPRPAVVTVMGHVDHGKTSLLDKIRKTSVTEGEAGGITQHIGAYLVSTPNGNITFLDTPGHEAFTAMRARGARVTDIVILVVAADDGVKPQTLEALNHAKDAQVPIIVAVNKIDKEGVSVERPRRELSALELVPEDWGGDTIFVDVSAKTGEGINDLLEMTLLQAEMLELKADFTCKATGIIIESTLDKGKGPVVTVLIQKGTLNVGESFVCGALHGKVRAMFNDKGEKINTASPSLPVEILGLSGVAAVGDSFIVVIDDKEARDTAEKRSSLERELHLLKPGRVNLQTLYEQLEENEVKDLKIVVKGDVQGSVQAVCDTLAKLPLDKVMLKVIHSSVGAITETDVLLASASNAIVVGFNVRPETKASSLAERDEVDIRLYSVIYNLVDDMRKAMIGKLSPVYVEKMLGKAEIREIFSVPKVGKIGGCFVLDGKVTRSAFLHLNRDGTVIFTGKVSSLRRFKEDTKEVNAGYECGIGLENYNDIKVGDVIEVFIQEQVENQSL